MGSYPERPLNTGYPPIPPKRFSMGDRADLARYAPGATSNASSGSSSSNPYLRALKSSESDSSLASIFNNQVMSLEKVRSETDMKPSYFKPLPQNYPNGLDASPFTRSYLPSGSVSRTEGLQRRSLRRSSGRHRRILNWENLGNRTVQKEAPYATEPGHLLPLLATRATSLQQDFSANIIALDAFMIDVKYLVVGISSESFVFNSELTFTMVPSLTLEDVAPSTFKSVIKEFIECGTCFKRLQLMTMRKDPNTFDHIYEGLIFKVRHVG